MGEAGATPGSEGVVLHGAVLPRGKAGHRWGYFVVTRLAFGVCVVRIGEGGQWGPGVLSAHWSVRDSPMQWRVLPHPMQLLKMASKLLCTLQSKGAPFTCVMK